MTLLEDPSELTGEAALFGGSFDPIHMGHIQIAKTAMERFSLSSVVFVPAWKNPLKDEHPSTSGEERIEMIRLAIQNEKNFFVSPFEINKSEPSYTIDTIKHFKSKSSASFSFILGSDSLKDFSKWKEHQSILDNVRLIVYERRGFPIESYPEFTKNFISGEWIDISSTFIRSELLAGRVPAGLIPNKVVERIRKASLYGIN